MTTQEQEAPAIPHKDGCSEPEPRRYPQAHRCPDCYRSVDLNPKPLTAPKPHKPGCRQWRLALFIGYSGDLCRWCLTCRGAFVIVARAGTYSTATAQELIANQGEAQ